MAEIKDKLLIVETLRQLAKEIEAARFEADEFALRLDGPRVHLELSGRNVLARVASGD